MHISEVIKLGEGSNQENLYFRKDGRIVAYTRLHFEEADCFIDTVENLGSRDIIPELLEIIGKLAKERGCLRIRTNCKLEPETFREMGYRKQRISLTLQGNRVSEKEPTFLLNRSDAVSDTEYMKCVD